jgi:hypothetical protein
MKKAVSKYEGTREELSPALAALNSEAIMRLSKKRFELCPAEFERVTITDGSYNIFPSWADTFLSGYFAGRLSK